MSTRTTLTLDDDVAATLAAEARRTGRPLKAVVNEALRNGLETAGRRKLSRYRVKIRDMRMRPGFDIDDIEGLLDQLEGPLRR